MKKIITLALLALISLALVLPAHAATPDPKRVNLVLSDMPTGFTLKMSAYHDNRWAAHENHETLATTLASGRLLGFETEYQSESLFGLLNVDATTLLYRTPALAAARYRYSSALGASSGQITPMSVPRIGTASSGWRYKIAKQGIKMTFYAVLFTRGAYVVLVECSGIDGTFTPASAVHFAQIIDARILTASKH